MTHDYKPDIQAHYIPPTDGANALADAPVYYETTDALAQRRPITSIPETIDSFVGDQAKISSAACVQAIVSAISSTHAIPPGDEDIPRPGLADSKPYRQWYRGRTKEGNIMPTYTDDRSGTTTIQLTGDNESAAWAYARQLGDFDADILLILLAQSGINQREDVTIRADQILRYRGIGEIAHPGRKASGYRDTDYRPIGAAMKRLAHIEVRLEGQRYHKNGKEIYYTYVAPLILISSIIYHNESYFNELGEQEENSYPVCWRFRIGEWITPFLTEDYPKWAWITQQALHYDAYHEIWEKRLARYMIFHLRMNAKNGTGQITRRIGTMLNDLHLDVNPRYPLKTKDRFQDALDQLVKDGIIDKWQGRDPKLPARKWLNDWLSCNVVIDVAPQSSTPYADIATHQQEHVAKVIALSAKKRGKRQ